MNLSTQPGEEPPALPLAEQDERTRARLIRAAVQVFDRKGYSSASVREIVEAAGVTKPALYYHFGSKEGMLVAILEEGAREFEAVTSLAAQRPGTTRERLMGLCEDVYGLFEKNVPVVRVVHSIFHGPDGNVPGFDFTRFGRSLELALAETVRAGQAAGEMRAADPADVAIAILGTIGACASRHLHAALEPIDAERFRRILDVVFDGVFDERR